MWDNSSDHRHQHQFSKPDSVVVQDHRQSYQFLLDSDEKSPTGPLSQQTASNGQRERINSFLKESQRSNEDLQR